MRDLEAGKNYGHLVGLKKERGSLIYNGDANFTATVDGNVVEQHDEGLRDKLVKFINTNSVSMGSLV